METTVTSAKAWAPDRVFAAAEQLAESLLFQTSTVLGRVEGDAVVARVAYVNEGTAQFTAEGDAIPESNPALAEVLVATGKVTQLYPVSHELWEQELTASALSDATRNAIIRKANQEYLTQPAPVAPAIAPATGLLNHPDITVHPTAVSANLDPLIDVISTVESLGAHPTHILLNPMAWAKLLKIKTQTGSAEALLGAGTNAADRQLLGLPVLVSEFMPADTGLVVDKSAIVSAAGDVRIAVSQDAYFTRDSVGVRATFRFGQNIVRPYRIAKFTVA